MIARLVEHLSKEDVRLLNTRIDLDYFQEGSHRILETALAVSRYTERENQLRVRRVRLESCRDHVRGLCELFSLQQNVHILKRYARIGFVLFPCCGSILLFQARGVCGIARFRVIHRERVCDKRVARDTLFGGLGGDRGLIGFLQAKISFGERGPHIRIVRVRMGGLFKCGACFGELAVL